MPINVFGTNYYLHDNVNEIDRSLILKKAYLRNFFNNRLSNFDEDTDMKNHFRNKNFPDRISIREPASNLYVDKKFNDPSIVKNTAQVDFHVRNLDNIRFVEINSMPALGEPLTAKFYVDQVVSNRVEEPTLVRIKQDKNFNNPNLTNINGITLKTQADDNQDITKSYADQFHQENEQARRNLVIDFHNDSSNLVKKSNREKIFNDYKLMNLNIVTVNRNPTWDNGLLI